jgi:hypothetical protein
LPEYLGKAIDELTPPWDRGNAAPRRARRPLALEQCLWRTSAAGRSAA